MPFWPCWAGWLTGEFVNGIKIRDDSYDNLSWRTFVGEGIKNLVTAVEPDLVPYNDYKEL